MNGWLDVRVRYTFSFWDWMTFIVALLIAILLATLTLDWWTSFRSPVK